MPVKQRIFVAVNLPDETKQQLYALQQNLHEQFVYTAGEETAQQVTRWTPVHNLHITLSFLGPLNEEQMRATKTAIGEVVQQHRPFSVSITQTLLAPPGSNSKSPHMIWADIGQADELMQLQNDVEGAIYDREEFVHKERDTKPFRPHLTLARFRKWQLQQLEREEIPNVEGGVDVAFPVNSVEIMQSTLKRSGAEHAILASYEL